MNATARIAFAGTPEFAVPVLEALAAHGARPALVLTQPDRPAGRGRRVTPSPVKQKAHELGIDVRTPERLDGASGLETLGPRPDLLVVVAYGLLLPDRLLEWPRLAPVNVHASLLPRWRGASPIQHAILSGDTETGVSLVHMVTRLDAGPVYARRATPIGVAETARGLHDRLAALGAALLVDELPRLAAGTATPEAQDEALATYAPKLTKADAVLDFTRPAAVLERRVRAFDPWPVAEARFAGGGRLRIWRAAALAQDAAGAVPGTIVAAGAPGIDVATGDGLLRLERVQPPSARPMEARAYLAAHDLRGLRFGG